MRKETYNDMVRVSRATAKKLFLAGKRIALFPANANVNSLWNIPTILSRKDKEKFVEDEIGMANIFEDTCNSYQYYNCNNHMGKYPKFFAET